MKKLLLCISLLSACAFANTDSENIKGFLGTNKSYRPNDMNYLKTYLFRALESAPTLFEKREILEKFLSAAQKNTNDWESGANSWGTFLSIMGGVAFGGLMIGTVGGALAAPQEHGAVIGLGIGTVGGTVIGTIIAMINAAICRSRLNAAYRNEAYLGELGHQLKVSEAQAAHSPLG